jgi:hypothetical protein
MQNPADRRYFPMNARPRCGAGLELHVSEGASTTASSAGNDNSAGPREAEFREW